MPARTSFSDRLSVYPCHGMRTRVSLIPPRASFMRTRVSLIPARTGFKHTPASLMRTR